MGKLCSVWIDSDLKKRVHRRAVSKGVQLQRELNDLVLLGFKYERLGK